MSSPVTETSSKDKATAPTSSEAEDRKARTRNIVFGERSFRFPSSQASSSKNLTTKKTAADDTIPKPTASKASSPKVVPQKRKSFNYTSSATSKSEAEEERPRKKVHHRFRGAQMLWTKETVTPYVHSASTDSKSEGNKAKENKSEESTLISPVGSTFTFVGSTALALNQRHTVRLTGPSEGLRGILPAAHLSPLARVSPPGSAVHGSASLRNYDAEFPPLGSTADSKLAKDAPVKRVRLTHNLFDFTSDAESEEEVPSDKAKEKEPGNPVAVESQQNNDDGTATTTSQRMQSKDKGKAPIRTEQFSPVDKSILVQPATNGSGSRATQPDSTIGGPKSTTNAEPSSKNFFEESRCLSTYQESTTENKCSHHEGTFQD